MESSTTSHPSDNPFALTSTLEIVSVLRNIITRNALLQLRVQPGSGSIVTTLLNVDTEAKTLTFDSAPDSLLTDRILSASRVHFETSVDNIHIHFHTGAAHTCAWEGASALCTAFPEEVVRVQRRDFFRMATPVTKPVTCTVPVEGKLVKLPLEDISAGGLSLFDDAAGLDHTIGVLYEDCRIELPEVGTVEVTLRIAHAKEITLNNGRIRYRLGCSFVSPSGNTLNLVQRYVSKLEREAIARKRGFA